jgi:hypothetical protein
LLASSYEMLGREREAVDAHVKWLAFGEEHQKWAAELRTAAVQGGLRGYWACSLDLVRRNPKARSATLAYAHL